jgi:hypothetical protein
VVKGWYPVTDQRNITVGRMAASPSIHVDVAPSTFTQHQRLLLHCKGILFPPGYYILDIEAVVALPWS